MPPEKPCLNPAGTKAAQGTLQMVGSPHPGPLPAGERESCGADLSLTFSPPACGRGRGRAHGTARTR